ncbi:serine-rich adhesin for platelets-like isoform X4 [Leptopilina boulardi]|uniref:serine-rich adhesin for platelets-like isoform X4 n=1 Tax=Leptopilina boulardi TaxID=63433 RepID=UPI0021F5D6B5|nr:serine-rich adhesin for platelets-like isoform X4 [Leptopilina boulardi]
MRRNFYFLLYLSVNSLIFLVYCKSIPSSNANRDTSTTVKDKNENYQIAVKQKNVDEAKNLVLKLIQNQKNESQQDIHVERILTVGDNIEIILDSIVEIFYKTFKEACCFEISINEEYNTKQESLIRVLHNSLLYYSREISLGKQNVSYQNFLNDINKLNSNVSFKCELEEYKCMYNNENFNSAKGLFEFVILIRYMVVESIKNLKSQQLNVNGINLNLIEKTMNVILNIRNLIQEQTLSSTFLNKTNKQLEAKIMQESNTKFNDVEEAYTNLINIFKKYAEILNLYKNITFCSLNSNDSLTMNQTISRLWNNKLFNDLTNYIRANAEFLSSEYRERSKLSVREILTTIRSTKNYFINILLKYRNTCIKNSTGIVNDRRNLAKNIRKFFYLCFEITRDSKNFIDDTTELIYYKDFVNLKLNRQINLFSPLLLNMQKILSSNNSDTQKSNEIRMLYNQLKNVNSVGLKKHVLNIFIEYLRHITDIIISIYNYNCPGSKNAIMIYQKKSISDSIEATYQVQKMLQNNISEAEMKNYYKNNAVQSIINSKNYNANDLIQNCQSPNGTLPKNQEMEDDRQKLNILYEIHSEYLKFFSNLKTKLTNHPFDDINLHAFLTTYSSTMKSIKTDLQVYSLDNGNNIIKNLTQILRETKNLSIAYYEEINENIPVLTDNEKKKLKSIDSILKQHLKIATDFFKTISNNYKCNKVNINNNSKIAESNISKLINFMMESITVYSYSHRNSYEYLNSKNVNKSEEMLKLIPTICGPQNKKNEYTINILSSIFNEYYLNFPDKFNDDVSDYSCYIGKLYYLYKLDNILSNFNFSNTSTNRSLLNGNLLSTYNNIHDCVLHKTKIKDESKEIAEIVKNITHESINLNLQFIFNIACSVFYNNLTINTKYQKAINSLNIVVESFEKLIKSFDVQNATNSKNLLEEVKEKYCTQKTIFNPPTTCKKNITEETFQKEILKILSFLNNKTNDVADTLSNNIFHDENKIKQDMQRTVSFVKNLRQIMEHLKVQKNFTDINQEGSTQPSQETGSTLNLTWIMPTSNRTSDIDRLATSQSWYASTDIKLTGSTLLSQETGSNKGSTTTNPTSKTTSELNITETSPTGSASTHISQTETTLVLQETGTKKGSTWINPTSDTTSDIERRATSPAGSASTDINLTGSTLHSQETGTNVGSTWIKPTSDTTSDIERRATSPARFASTDIKLTGSTLLSQETGSNKGSNWTKPTSDTTSDIERRATSPAGFASTDINLTGSTLHSQETGTNVGSTWMKPTSDTTSDIERRATSPAESASTDIHQTESTLVLQETGTKKGSTWINPTRDTTSDIERRATSPAGSASTDINLTESTLVLQETGSNEGSTTTNPTSETTSKLNISETSSAGFASTDINQTGSTLLSQKSGTNVGSTWMKPTSDTTSDIERRATSPAESASTDIHQTESTLLSPETGSNEGSTTTNPTSETTSKLNISETSSAGFASTDINQTGSTLLSQKSGTNVGSTWMKPTSDTTSDIDRRATSPAESASTDIHQTESTLLSPETGSNEGSTTTNPTSETKSELNISETSPAGFASTDINLTGSTLLSQKSGTNVGSTWMKPTSDTISDIERRATSPAESASTDIHQTESTLVLQETGTNEGSTWMKPTSDTTSDIERRATSPAGSAFTDINMTESTLVLQETGSNEGSTTTNPTSETTSKLNISETSPAGFASTDINLTGSTLLSQKSGTNVGSTLMKPTSDTISDIERRATSPAESASTDINSTESTLVLQETGTNEGSTWIKPTSDTTSDIERRATSPAGSASTDINMTESTLVLQETGSNEGSTTTNPTSETTSKLNISETSSAGSASTDINQTESTLVLQETGTNEGTTRTKPKMYWLYYYYYLIIL